MVIDPEVEEPTRELLGHAVRGELNELAGLMTDLAPERFVECLGLCLRVSGYIAIDVSGPGWPTDAHLRRLAQLMADTELDFNLEEPEVYDFLSRAVLNFESIFDVFPDKEKAVAVPVLTTAALLGAYRTGGADWEEYLDNIEHALEETASLSEGAFPAALLWSKLSQAIKAKAAEQDQTGA